MERIAVIIPAHNRPQMLRRAIRSVLAQVRSPDEFVVIDDGSTENLVGERELVVESGGKWIRLDRTAVGTTHGPGPARNAGVAATGAEWVAFLDSDDEWHREKLALQLRWHEENTEFLISQVEEEWLRNGRYVRKPRHLHQPSGELFSESCLRCAIGPSCTLMHRRLWDEFGGFDPRFRVCEDYELWLRITAHHSVGLIPGGPLSRKFGGHEDQLSTATPLLERYRLLALLEFLRRKDGTKQQREKVSKAIHRFGGQLLQYSESKGNGTWTPALTALLQPGEASDAIVSELWSILLDEPKNAF